MHFPVFSACTAYVAVPISTWDQKFRSGDPCSHSTQLIKEQACNLITRPLYGAYTDRKVTTRWPTISFTKMILSETLCTSETFSIHSSATNTPTPAVLCHFWTSRACTLLDLPQWPNRASQTNRTLMFIGTAYLGFCCCDCHKDFGIYVFPG